METSRVKLLKFVLPHLADSRIYSRVESIADRLHEHLNHPETIHRIAIVNQPGNSSSKVQDAFLEFAQQLGFESERKGLFKDSGLALRPDYFLPLGETGILLEVERGKTTINNMDLLDFWKCHLCGEANHLKPPLLTQSTSHFFALTEPHILLEPSGVCGI